MTRQSPASTASNKVDICIRCNGNMSWYGEYPNCIQCGWQDYDRIKIEKRGVLPEEMRTSIVFLPFVGSEKRMKDKTVKVWFDKITKNTAIVYRPECPHCGKVMQRYAGHSSNGTANKGNGIREYYFICKLDHRIRLIDSNVDGFLGWR